MSLSIVTVTNCEPHAERFIARMRKDADALGAELVIGIDRESAPKAIEALADVAVRVKSKGYVESVLDEVLKHCTGDYILRLDDDETISVALLDWLAAEWYEAGEVFAFVRPYFWGDERHFLPALLPDYQTRLSTKAKAGGRNEIHVGSPYGTGQLVPFPIEHHKFLVKSRAEREAIAARYESIRPGAGTLPHFGMYNLPEMYFETLEVMDYSC